MVSISEDGESRKISKRRGDVILLDDVVDAIGVDAARYFLVQRSHDQPIEIDVELAPSSRARTRSSTSSTRTPGSRRSCGGRRGRRRLARVAGSISRRWPSRARRR